jgi:periplasmic protein TonB
MRFDNGLITMSDSAPDNAIMYGGLPPPDWQAVAPTLGIRSIAAIVLVVPLLLVAGVYWLHQLPSTITQGNSGDVIEVRLLGPQDSNMEGQDVSEQARTAPTPPADPLIDDQNHAIPTETVAPMPPMPQRSSPAALSSFPAPPQGALNKALMYQRALLSHIARYRQHPGQGRIGHVQLMFSMLRDGTVTDVWITSGSGDTIVDRAAIETIRKAQPMPKIPAELPEQMNIQVPIVFEAD